MGTMILANVAGHMHQPLLPLYLQELGAGVGQVGRFFTLGAIAPLAFQILGGWLSDSVGRLQAIAIGSTAGVLGYFVYVFAPSWEWLLMATATGAMARSFVMPSYMAFIANEIAALIAPRPFLNILSYFDVAYGNQEFLAEVGVQLYQVYRLYGKPDAFSYFMHGNDHSFPQYSRALAYEWLDRFLRPWPA
jgi:MFS family permease